MKNLKILAIAAVFFAVEPAVAQSDTHTSSRDARRKIVFGFKGGFNRSNVYDQGSRNFVADTKTGGVVGGFLCIPFGDFIGFQPELLYSQKGFKGTGVINGEFYEISRTTNHLDIPLQLQLKPFGWLSMLAGIQYSYLLSQRDELSRYNNYEQINKEFVNDDIRKNLVGILMGGDVNFWHVVFSARVGWDIISNHGDGNSSTPQYKNYWVQGTLGYRIY
jgi:hypothetical protein